MDWLLALAAIAVLVGLTYIGSRLEPHWTSKDGRRFLCNGRILSTHGQPVERWRETRGLVLTDGAVRLDQKRMMQRRSSVWTLTAESPDPPKRRAVFLVRGRTEAGHEVMMALQMPATSRTVPVLRAALQR